MNENTAPSSSDTNVTVEDLRHQLNSVLILTCVVSLTLTVFLGLQYFPLQGEVQKARLFMAEQQKRNVPVIQDLGRKLVEYSKSHPEVRPILGKYQPALNYFGVIIPTNAPAPVKQ